MATMNILLWQWLFYGAKNDLIMTFNNKPNHFKNFENAF